MRGMHGAYSSVASQTNRIKHVKLLAAAGACGRLSRHHLGPELRFN